MVDESEERQGRETLVVDGSARNEQLENQRGAIKKKGHDALVSDYRCMGEIERRTLHGTAADLNSYLGK